MRVCACVRVFVCVCVELESRCEHLMLIKFGKLVDLEALQTLSGNRSLEEMRQESRIREVDYIQELKAWEVSHSCPVSVCAQA